MQRGDCARTDYAAAESSGDQHAATGRTGGNRAAEHSAFKHWTGDGNTANHRDGSKGKPEYNTEACDDRADARDAGAG
jgi:hypothetical protein